MSTLSMRLIQPIEITTYDTPNGLPLPRTTVKHPPVRAIIRCMFILSFHTLPPKSHAHTEPAQAAESTSASLALTTIT